MYTCERNDASRCRWSEERLATTTRGSFDVKCVRDRCPCRDAIEQDRWRHSCHATDRLFRFADRRDKTNTNVLLEISNVGAREGVSFQSVSAIHGSAGRSQSLPARYLSRRRRIEIAHNLVLTERQIKVGRISLVGCISSFFASFRSGFRIGRREREQRSSFTHFSLVLAE